MREGSYEDRREAGRELAEALDEYAGRDDVVVLGLVRGGMPVAAEIARHLEAPLDVMIVRKLGAPRQPELAVGAITSGGSRVLNDEIVERLGLSDERIDEIAERERGVLEERERTYRPGEAVSLEGRTVLLVDDGLATGATMRAAIASARDRGAAEVVVAVPVAAQQSCRAVEKEADAFVCPLRSSNFFGVSQFFRSFPQVQDEEVGRLLERFRDEEG